MKTEYCRYTLAQVKESGLLSPERMAEVEWEIESRIEPVFLKSGKEVLSAKCLIKDDGTGMLYPRQDSDHMQEHVRRDALSIVLSKEELEMVNELALSVISLHRDEADFEKAEKVTEWDGGVFVGDTFHSSLEDAMDMNEEGLPAWLFVAESQPVIPRFDVAYVVENFISDLRWEDMDESDLRGKKEFQEAIDAFVKANEGVLSYSENRKKVLILQPTEEPQTLASDLQSAGL